MNVWSDRPAAAGPTLPATDQTNEPLVSNAAITGSISDTWTEPLAIRAVPATVKIWRIRPRIAGFNIIFVYLDVIGGCEEFARLHRPQALLAGRNGGRLARPEAVCWAEPYECTSARNLRATGFSMDPRGCGHHALTRSSANSGRVFHDRQARTSPRQPAVSYGRRAPFRG